MLVMSYCIFWKLEGGRGDWMELAQDRDTCEYGEGLSGSIKMRGIS
jgi:hypothetical protein